MTTTRGQVLRSRAALLASVLALIVGAFYVLPLAVPTAFKEAGESGSLRLKELRTLHSDYEITRLAWHPNKRELAVGQSLHRKITIWNTDTGQVIRVLDKEVGSVGALAYSPDGKYLAVGRDFVQIAKPHLHLYDAASGELVRSFMPPQARKDNAVHALAFSPDSKYLVVNGYVDPGTGAVYAIPMGEVIAQLGDGGNMLDALAVSPDGHAEQERLKDTERMGEIHSLAFSPDGRWLAVGRTDRSDSWIDKWNRQMFDHVGRIELRSTDSWEVTRSITIPSSTIIDFRVDAVTFSPDSKHLAARTVPVFGGALNERTGKWETPERGDSVRLWDVATAKQIGSLASSHAGGVHETLQYARDGTLLFVGGVDKNIEIWHVDSATRLRTLDGFSENVHFSLNRTNTILATASGEEITLWELTRQP